MSRILLITRYFPPLDSIATNRMWCWARYLQEMGHTLTVLTTSKKGQVVQPLLVDTTGLEVVELDYLDPICLVGVDKKRSVSSGPPRGFKGWAAQFYRHRMNERMPGRTDPWIFPAVSELRAWSKQGRKFDAVISSYGPPSAHVVGYFAKKMFDALWVADYRDLWLENHVFEGIWPFTWVEWCVEKRLLRRADHITTVSDALARVLQGKFPRVPVHVIENGFDAESMDEARADYFQGKKEVMRLVYTGSIYPGRRDPSPLFSAVKRMQPKNFEIWFYGSHAGNLSQLVSDHGVEEWVRDGGCVPQKEAWAIQKSCDALLFLEDPNPLVDGILTGKLFEYLYAGKPILAVGIGPDSAPGNLIREVEAGVVCGTDVDFIGRNLRELLNGKWQYNGRWEKIGRYARKEQVRTLEALLRC